jgi:integrase
MDPWAWQELDPWMTERRNYPPGPLFCVIEGPTAGTRAWAYADVACAFRTFAKSAGIRRRFAPHQLRHAWTLEAFREGMPSHVIMRQLGHANLAITTTYIQALSSDEVIDIVHKRSAPVMPITGMMTSR